MMEGATCVLYSQRHNTGLGELSLYNAVPAAFADVKHIFAAGLRLGSTEMIFASGVSSFLSEALTRLLTVCSGLETHSPSPLH